jgi:hypothetical protein
MVDELQGPRGRPGGGPGADRDGRIVLDTSTPLAHESADEGPPPTRDGSDETPFAGIKASGVHAPPLTRGSMLWVARLRRLFGLRF